MKKKPATVVRQRPSLQPPPLPPGGSDTASLHQYLDSVFERMANNSENGVDISVSPQPQPLMRPSNGATSPPPAAALKPVERGDVEAHQAFRIRRTMNGHRLPPLSENTFDAKLEKSRRQQQLAPVLPSRLHQVEQQPRHTATSMDYEQTDLPPVRVHKQQPQGTTVQHRSSPSPTNLSTSQREVPQSHDTAVSKAAVSSSLSITTRVPDHSIHDDIHRRHCGLCSESFRNEIAKGLERLRSVEFHDRQRLELLMAADREGQLTNAWVALRVARDAELHKSEALHAAKLHVIRRMEALDEWMTRQHREGRRALTMEWDVGFDEIAALERISVRHMNQIREVHERKVLRNALERDQTIAANDKREEERRTTREQMAKNRISKDEVFERDHITREEAAVMGAYTQVFRETRRKIFEAETYVGNMLARHAARLQSIESEKDKLKMEEAIRREQSVATEKRSFEMIMMMEPESRRKETNKEMTRVKKETAEKMVIEDAMYSARNATSALEIEAREDMLQKKEKDHQRVAFWESRRVLREERASWRRSREIVQRKELLQEDNLAWYEVQQTFIRNLTYPCRDEEAAVRHSLMALKKKEKDFIWGLLRARLFLCQEERRVRGQNDEEEKLGMKVLEDNLRRSKTFATFLWFEQIERRGIVAEFESIAEGALTAYQAKLKEAAECTAGGPLVRNDRTTTPSGATASVNNGKQEFGVWVRYNSITWFWLSDDVILLDGCTARAVGGGASVLSELPTALDVTAELLNGDEGDEVIYEDMNNSNEPLPIRSRKSVTASCPVKYSTRDLFGAFRFRNTEPFSRTKLFPRVIRISIGDALKFHVWVVPAPPICPMPEQCITARTVFPLAQLSIPNHTDFKSCRLILQLDATNSGPMNGGHRLALLFPNEFTMHQKNGLMYQGKVLMKPKNISDRLIEIEFESKPASVLKTFLQYIAVQHGDDTSLLAPLRLDVFLMKKSDGSNLKISQQIDIDQADTAIPRLRVPGPELFCRLRSCYPPGTADEVLAHVPPNPQHVFSSCCVVFPKDQPDVQSGMFKFSLSGADGMTTLGLQCSSFGPQLMVDTTNTQLYCLLDDATLLSSAQPSQTWLAPNLSRRISSKKILANAAASLTQSPRGNASNASPRNNSAGDDPLASTNNSTVSSNRDGDFLRKLGFTLIADVVGLDSTQLLIQLRGNTGVILPHAVIHQLMQSVVVTTTRKEMPPKKSEISMTLSLTADIGLKSDPIHAMFKLTVLPALLECSARNSAFPYREGAGPKTLPSLSMRATAAPNASSNGGGLPLLSADAMLTVKIMSGLEDSDILDVLDCEVREDGTLVHMQNSQPVAEIRRLGQASLSIMLAGQFCGAEWLREDQEDCYSLASNSQLISSKYDVTLQHVNVLLRSITYNCTSVNPQEERKALLVSLDDGRTGRSSVVLDLTVESVDDPTDIIIDDPVVEFRQFSKKANIGCPILASVRLEDIDSDNFHGGYIVVEHASGPAEPGDHLYILTPKQQEQLLYRAQGTSSVSRLQHLLSSVTDLSQCRALAVVVDEQPQPILSLRDNRYMVYNGETIGQLVAKQTGTSKDEKTTYSLRYNFSSESKFISFSTAQYCLRCFGYDNRSAKMNTLQRQYQITLNCTGLKSTADTVERVTIDGYVALLSNPTFAASIRFEEGGKPKHVLKQASTALQQAQLYQRGYLRATILNAFDGDEVQIDPSSSDFKVKDGRTVLCAKENVATIIARKTQSAIHIDFVKVTNQTLQNLVRSLVYNTVTRMMDPTQRQIEIECSTGEEVDLCSVTVAVDISRRDEPVEFHVSPDAPQPFLHMSGQPAMRLTNPYLDIHFRKPFAPTSEVEVSIPEKPKLGEHLTFGGTEDVDLIEDNDAQRIYFWVNGKSVAFTQKPKSEQEDDGTYLCTSKSLTLQFTSEMHPPDMKCILDTLGYVNTSKGDRGARKIITLGFKSRGATIAKYPIAVDILNPMLDFSLCAPVVNSAGLAVVASACRLQLSPALRQVEIAVMMVTGYDYSDALSLKFPANNPFGLVLSSLGGGSSVDSPLFKNASSSTEGPTSSLIIVTNSVVAQGMQQQQQQSTGVTAAALSSSGSEGVVSPTLRSSKRGSMSNLRNASGALTEKGFVLASATIQSTSIVISASGSPLSNSALQAVLRSVCLTGEARGDKDVLLEVTVSSPLCGQCRELVRVLM
ncbi:Hypothetical protein, putative [Bodo saltans]|uniref:Uncharacterized protein n=1 Tax=Bodo saltans TaxID=75058 RepID=A0A0S4JW76_BODSA|nr:Hypothetical protein, putative [Bodo saltans]|eukprot:CUG94292.1 Hypothetical protein, putative [Bodo saltans]